MHHRSNRAHTTLQQSMQVSHSLANQILEVEMSKQRQIKRDRSCKTTSPTQFKNQESRIRKKSKDIMQKKIQFADLIVVLGLKYNEFVEQKRVQPQVVETFSILSKDQEAKQHSYIENLIWICFPQRYRVKSFEKKKEVKLCKYKTFHFIITNQDGEKKYITSILFKELFLTEKRGAFIVPKSICLVSSMPIFTLQKQLLDLIFKKVIVPNNSDSIRSYDHSQTPANYIPYMNMLHEDLIRQNVDAYLMQRFEFYLTVFFNHLYYSDEIECDIEVEQITERKATTTHKSTKKSSNREITRLFRFRNTKSYGFTLENYSYELLLSLKPERIMFLITALLLERKIILIKKDFGDIALIMESLVSLLNPLKWNFVFITYLTPKLVDCLEAPFPYIIGVSRKIWEDHCQMREFPDDIIIYDIDQDNMLNKVREEVPPLPQPQASVLQRTLKEVLDMKERFTETLQEQLPKQISKDKIDEFYWAYAQLKVKQRFFNFFLLTINNYIGCFKNLDEEGNLSPNKKDKKYYDKLSSIDIFDFDGYTNLFEGENKKFIQKLVHTQSFNNFIEDTYKNQSPHTPIGFFKTNFDVMIEYSFRRLEKEQNKLIHKIFFNLQNPVRFNISHMFKLYKKGILKKYQKKIIEQQEDEVLMNDLEQQDTIDLNKQDQVEKMLLSMIESNPTTHSSIINQVSQELITEMPGIEYDKINTYRQMKQQKSETSLDRNLVNKSMNAFDFQRRVQQESYDADKSRNYKLVGNSRSGGVIAPANNVYKNYLSMADNKRQQEAFNQSQQLFSYDDQRDPGKQLRVHSENSFVKGSLNKTVIVNQSSHLNRAPTTVQAVRDAKAKTLRIDKSNLINKTSTALQQIASLGEFRSTSSPRLISKPRVGHNPTSLSQTSFLIEPNQQPSNIILPSISSTRQVLKSTLERKQQYQRAKHALHMKTEASRQLVNQSLQLIQAQMSPIGQGNNKLGESKNAANSSFLNSQNWKCIPKTNIDLMDPKKKKISRNEERILAKKRGFLGFETQNSSMSFYLPKEVELANNVILRNDSSLVQKDPIESQSFTNFVNSNYHSNVSEEETKGKQHNQITFKKRQQDPHSTTINFQSTFIKQKPQMPQSPIVNSTDFSNSKFSIGEDLNNQSQSPQMNQNSQKRRDLLNRMKYSSPLHVGFTQQTNQTQNLSQSANLDKLIQQSKTSLMMNPQLSQFKKNLLKEHKYQKQQSDKLILQLQDSVDPSLTLQKESQSAQTPSQHIQLGQKHPQLKQSESPSNVVESKLMSQSFKSFANQTTQNMSKRLAQAANRSPPLTSSNQKSNILSSKPQASTKAKKMSQMATFDNSQSSKQKQHVILSRKRSSPAIGQDKLSASATQNKKGEKVVKSSNDLPKVGEHKTTKSTLVKPTTTISSKQMKQPVVYQIQLDKKERKVEDYSLRVSPIPDLDDAIRQQSNTQDLPRSTISKKSQNNSKIQSKAYQSSTSMREGNNYQSQKRQQQQVIEIEIFDKAQNAIDLPISVKHQAKTSSVVSNRSSSRSNTMDHNQLSKKFKTRTSNISQDSQVRITESRQDILSQDGQLYRQSELLSNEGSGNVSMMKGSPALSHQQQKPPIGMKNNFLIMGSQTMKGSSYQPEILNTFKQDQQHSIELSSSMIASPSLTYSVKMHEDPKFGFQQEEVVETMRDSKPNKINNQSLLRKKLAKSPQPSSQVISSNLYLRQTQNQQKKHPFFDINTAYNSNQAVQQSSYVAAKEVCHSTKNLYGGINREQLLIEINNINQSINQNNPRRSKVGSGQLSAYSSQQISPTQVDTMMYKQRKESEGLPSMLPSIKYQGISQKNIESKLQKQVDEENFSSRQNKELESDSEVIIDLPRQMPPGDFTRLKSQDQLPTTDRKSELIVEIDKLMEEKPFRRLPKGLQTSKNNFLGIRSQKESFAARDRSDSQPLVELKYNSNELPLRIGKKKYHQHQKSSSSLNNSKHVTGLGHDQRHSYVGDKVNNYNSLAKQKKRSFRHGLTTCLIFPNKESAQYVKRDLNQDAFCKITSHLGDVDNDPHTPKSNGSFRSNEKARRKEHQMRHQNSQKVLLQSNLIFQISKEREVGELLTVPMAKQAYSVNAIQSAQYGSFEFAPVQKTEDIDEEI